MMWEFLRRKFLIAGFAASALLVVGGFLWALVALFRTAPPLIIHFTAERGINEIGTLWHLAAIAAIGISAILINFFLAMELEKRTEFLGELIAGVTLLVGVLIFIYFRVIIGVNSL